MNQLYIYICPYISSLLRLPPSHPILLSHKKKRNGVICSEVDGAGLALTLTLTHTLRPTRTPPRTRTLSHTLTLTLTLTLNLSYT